MTTQLIEPCFTAVRLRTDVSNNEILQSFNFPASNIKIIFEASSDNIFLSRGMVSIHYRIESLNDIYRVMQAATNIPCLNSLIFRVSKQYLFEIDHHPLMSINAVIGHFGNLLTVQIRIIEIPVLTLNLIRELCDVHKHHIEEILVEEIN